MSHRVPGLGLRLSRHLLALWQSRGAGALCAKLLLLPSAGLFVLPVPPALLSKTEIPPAAAGERGRPGGAGGSPEVGGNCKYLGTLPCSEQRLGPLRVRRALACPASSTGDSSLVSCGHLGGCARAGSRWSCPNLQLRAVLDCLEGTSHSISFQPPDTSRIEPRPSTGPGGSKTRPTCP